MEVFIPDSAGNYRCEGKPADGFKCEFVAREGRSGAQQEYAEEMKAKFGDKFGCSTQSECQGRFVNEILEQNKATAIGGSANGS